MPRDAGERATPRIGEEEREKKWEAALVQGEELFSRTTGERNVEMDLRQEDADSDPYKASEFCWSSGREGQVHMGANVGCFHAWMRCWGFRGV